MSEQLGHTPPHIKWLANELAATTGEMARIDEELARLAARRAHLGEVFRALSQVSGLVGAPNLAESVPQVRAHAKYGSRGRLRAWLKLLLRQAGPGAVDTPTMVRLAEDAFNLKFGSNKERDRYRKNTLTRQLRGFLKLGLVERVHAVRAAAGSLGVWRWRAEVHTFAELAARASHGRNE